MLRIIYTVFLGILLALFVGVGIDAFYQSPKAPEPVHGLYQPAPMGYPASPSADFLRQQEEYDRSFQAYQKQLANYNKNVSVISVVAAILFLIISLSFFKKFLILSDGLLLGGVLTLVYSIVRGFNSNDSIYRFLVVTVGLVTTLVLGYLKFLKPYQPSSKN